METHALLTPTSRGMRAALKQEDIEFTMPLKKSPDKQDMNRSGESGISVNNGSFSNSSEDQGAVSISFMYESRSFDMGGLTARFPV